MNLPEVKAKTKVVDRREESAKRVQRAKEYDSVSMNPFFPYAYS